MVTLYAKAANACITSQTVVELWQGRRQRGSQ